MMIMIMINSNKHNTMTNTVAISIITDTGMRREVWSVDNKFWEYYYVHYYKLTKVKMENLIYKWSI